MNKMANPDVVVKPGTIECVRRVGKIHLSVARFVDNYAVALCPGSTGKAVSAGAIGLNDRSMPLYDAYRIQTGFPNRLCISAATLAGWS